MDRPSLRPKAVYLDHHATTPLDPRVIDAMLEVMHRLPGNPNSVEHCFGQAAAAMIKDAQSDVAALVGSEPKQIIFTSSASDAIRKALALALHGRLSTRVSTSPVEHPAMLGALRALERDGQILLNWLNVDNRGQIEMASLKQALSDGTDLVCLMMANNEVGTIYPIEAILESVSQAGALIIVDATQAAGRLDLRKVGKLADFMVLSAHKFYGPQGVGALMIQDARQATASIFDHAGTPNVAGIVGMGAAARLALLEIDTDRSHSQHLRDQLQTRLSTLIPTLVVNGDLEYRLPHSLHISIPGVPNDAVVARIGNKVAISTGAACASGAQAPSHVLQAMGLPEPLIESALRLSVGRFNTPEEIEFAIDTIVDAVQAVQGIQKEVLPC